MPIAVRKLPVCLLLAAGVVISPGFEASEPVETTERKRRGLPVDFVENRGQWQTSARFVARQGEVTVALEPEAIRLQLGERALKLALSFEGATPGVKLLGEARQPGVYNYFMGSDASAWRTGVPAFNSVIYRKLYDGVDVRVREQAGLFEYDVLLSPRADLSRVVIRADGASRLELLDDGSLLMHTAEGPLRQTPPRTMEVLPSGSLRDVASRFRIIDEHRYGFEVPVRDEALPLVIDPGLEWSTLLGGSGSDPVGGVATVRDGSGDVVVAAWPNSPDYPSDGSGSPGVNNSVAVVRLNATGTTLRYTTFFGGWHSHLVYRGLAVNTAGEVVVGGEAYPADFPTTPGAFDRVRDGDSPDGFVTKLNAAGVLTASTFLGGQFSDSVVAIAFAPDGSIVAGGNTTSSEFPTTAGAFDRTYNPPNASADGGAHGDMFIARLSSDLSALTYGTFIGGPSLDVLEDIAVDPLGFVNVTGWVTGNNAPVFVSTPGAFDSSWNGSQDVAFARLKLDGAGAADLKYATLMGGSGQDNAVAVAFDPNNPGLVTIAGSSWSDNFPTTAGVIKPTNPPFSPLFPAKAGIVARFQFPASGGGSRVWSTYFGTSGFECAAEDVTDLAISGTGDVIIAGRTERTGFVTTRGAFDRTHAGSRDGYVARLSTDGTQLPYSTLFGGADDDSDFLDYTPLISYVSGNTVLVAGATGSTDFPVTTGALQTTHANPEGVGTMDGYVLRLALDPDASGDLTVDAPVLLSPANASAFSGNGYVTLTWSEVSDVSGVDSYEYQVSPKPDFPENFLHYKSSVAGTSARLPNLGLVQWFWRVRTADRAGNLSAWSSPSSFTLGAAGGRKSITAVGILPSTVVGGESANGLVYINGPAPAGGIVVDLVVQNSTAFTFGASRSVPMPITIPASVTVPAGATQVPFTATTGPVSVSTPAYIRATIDGVGQTGALTLEPPGTVGTIRLDFTPLTLTGGKGATGKVTLGAPAAPGGQVVTIGSLHPLTARSDVTTVTVAEGATTATFPVSTSPVPVAVDASFRVVSNRASWSSSLFVRPALPRLLSLTFSPSTVNGGQNVTGTVTVNAPMPMSKWPSGPNEQVRIWSSDPLVADVGSTFGAIAGGATSGTFTAFTRGRPDTRSVTFFAALDDVVVSAQVTVNAAPPISLSSVTFQPNVVNGGQGGIGRVNLAAATTTQVFVPLTSSDPGAVSMPSGVTLFAGDTSSSFSFVSANRSTAANVNVTATFGNASATGTLTVNPSTSVSKIPLASLSVDRLTAPAGTSAIGTATLTSVARPGGVTVQLGTSDFAVAEVPFNIVVPAGQTSANFTITTKTVTAPSDVVIHGLADNFGMGQSAGLTVTPGTVSGPTLSSLSLSPSSVNGGTSSTGTVTLSGAAPSGGRVVSLSSSNTAVATVPASVTVSAGATSRTFTITTQTVTSQATSTITGTLGSTSRSAVLTVNTAPPPVPAAPSLVSPSNGASVTLPVTLDWNDVSGAASYQIQVDDSSGFTSPRVIDQIVTVSQLTASSPTVTGVQHWWRVRGRNSAGTAGAWSSVRSFTPSSAPPPPPPTGSSTLSVTASGRSGERITSSPTGINVSVGSTGSASFANGTSITLTVSNGREAIWSGACSSSGNKRRTCTFTLNANGSVTANVQ
jgi:hypothetical protein